MSPADTVKGIVEPTVIISAGVETTPTTGGVFFNGSTVTGYVAEIDVLLELSVARAFN